MVGYVDPSEAARAALQADGRASKAPCFATLEDALDATDGELVLGTVRTEAHFQVAQRALESGRHVMLEKPFAATMAEAKALVELAIARGRVLAVSQNYRYFPGPILAARIMAEGKLGASDHVRLDFRQHGPSVGYRYWDMPDPLLADMSIHHFDLMRMVLGSEPLRIACRTWNPPESPFRFDCAGSAMITFANGIHLDYHGSWMSGGPRTPWAGAWAMDFRDGMVEWTSRDQFVDAEGPDRLSIQPLGGASVPEVLPEVPYLDRIGTLNATCRMIETGIAPPHFSSGADNLMSFALTSAALLSASRDGAWTEIAEVLDR